MTTTCRCGRPTRDLKGVLVAWVLFCTQEAVRNQSPTQNVPDDDLTSISRWLLNGHPAQPQEDQ